VASVGIVVLAAGRSTRFKQGSASKLLAVVGGVPLVRSAVAAAIESGVGEVVVVTGHRAHEVAAALDGLRVRLTLEPAFADGMAASLRRGVIELSNMSAVMVGLGDQPGMRPDAYRRVVRRWRTSGAPIVVPCYAESSAPAHPVLFAAPVFDEILALHGDMGARSIIAHDRTRVAEETLEWAAPNDVDTLEDLEALESGSARSPNRDADDT
jgi:molybdenum cofactor cytidylyltransferase